MNRYIWNPSDQARWLNFAKNTFRRLHLGKDISWVFIVSSEWNLDFSKHGFLNKSIIEINSSSVLKFWGWNVSVTVSDYVSYDDWYSTFTILTVIAILSIQEPFKHVYKLFTDFISLQQARLTLFEIDNRYNISKTFYIENWLYRSDKCFTDTRRILVQSLMRKGMSVSKSMRLPDHHKMV